MMQVLFSNNNYLADVSRKINTLKLVLLRAMKPGLVFTAHNTEHTTFILNFRMLNFEVFADI